MDEFFEIINKYFAMKITIVMLQFYENNYCYFHKNRGQTIDIVFRTAGIEPATF